MDVASTSACRKQTRSNWHRTTLVLRFLMKMEVWSSTWTRTEAQTGTFLDVSRTHPGPSFLCLFWDAGVVLRRTCFASVARVRGRACDVERTRRRLPWQGWCPSTVRCL